MSEKIKGMFGSEIRAYEVREWLKSQGATEHTYQGNLENRIYYVDKGQVKIIEKEHSCLFDIVELTRWRAKGREVYYYVTEGGYVFSKVDDAISSDNDRFKVGNYFKTREEAETYAEKFRELFKRKETE